MPICDIDNLEEAKLRLKYERGDYIDKKEIQQTEQLLRKFKKDRNFIEACERAAASAALTANKKSNTSMLIALIALVTSLANLLWQIYGHGGQP